MAVEQIRSDSRAEKWFGSRRKILMSAQGLQFFSEPPAALLILLFQHHATSEMRGCLRVDGAEDAGELNSSEKLVETVAPRPI
jgi:hypothetical protein